MKKERFQPMLVAKLKEPITHVEVRERECGGSLLVFAGTLSGWMDPELLESLEVPEKKKRTRREVA